ncbi:RAMP superfamily CRISPR-associated protein [Vibrio breoganii]
MSTDVLKLIIDIESDWHVGSGEEAGAYADSLTLKSPSNLPYLPGKSLKGLLKTYLRLAMSNNWLSHDDFSLLFGTEGQEQSSQGLLQVTNAELSSGEQVYLTSTPGATKCLYRVLQFTAIEHTSQVAKETSLRSMEVAVPMRLVAMISLNTSHPSFDSKHQASLLKIVGQSAKLISNIGAKKYRGLGKANVTYTLTTAEECA